MITGHQKKGLSHGPGKEKEPADAGAGRGSGDACRCEETSKMSARELLKLMISDLAFWKKTNKE
jgi:hypothetical protein